MANGSQTVSLLLLLLILSVHIQENWTKTFVFPVMGHYQESKAIGIMAHGKRAKGQVSDVE